MDSAAIRDDGRPARPAGGYRLIPARHIAVLWWAHKTGRITAAGFRAWAAAQEALARRCMVPRRKAPRFEIEELHALTGLSRKRLGEAIRRLETAGLLRLRPDSIEFGDDRGDDRGDDFRDFLEAIPNRARLVPVPRRILRLIAQGARPALVAVAFAHLLRCLYIKDGRCDGRGRCKASWVATTFGIDLRRVKHARSELVAIGWLVPVDGDPQWARNRWGGAFRIDLDWDRADEGRRTPSPPPPAQTETRPTPPGSPNEEPLSRLKNQKPAAAGPAGVEIPEQGGGRAKSAIPRPDLRHVVAADLVDTSRLLKLRDQAAALGLIGNSESDSLRFIAAAEHSRSIAIRNAPGLFAAIVRRGLWGYATGSDETTASSRLRRHRHGDPPPRVPPPAARSLRGSLSPDAELVVAVVAAARSAGHRGDAYFLVRRDHPDWSRARWESALREVECHRVLSSSSTEARVDFGLPPAPAGPWSSALGSVFRA